MTGPKRVSAADLRRNLEGFEKSTRERLAYAEQALVDFASSSDVERYQGQRDALRGVLVSLHIWTDGEFGDTPPASQGGVQ